MPSKIPTTHFDRVVKSRGNKMVRELKKSAKKHKATGELENSIRWVKVNEPGRTGFKIIYKWYGDVLDKGLSGYETPRATPFRAGHGKLPAGLGRQSVAKGTGTIPVRFESVREWIAAKGIGDGKKSTAFLIHRSIKREGYPASKWLSRVKRKNMKQVQIDLANAYKKDLAFFITKGLI